MLPPHYTASGSSFSPSTNLNIFANKSPHLHHMLYRIAHQLNCLIILNDAIDEYSQSINTIVPKMGLGDDDRVDSFTIAVLNR